MCCCVLLCVVVCCCVLLCVVVCCFCFCFCSLLTRVAGRPREILYGQVARPQANYLLRSGHALLTHRDERLETQTPSTSSCTTGAPLPCASFAAAAFDGGCLPAHGLRFFLLEPVFSRFEACLGSGSLTPLLLYQSRNSFQLRSLDAVRRGTPLAICRT